MGLANEPAVLGQVVCPGDVVMRLPETGIVRVGGGLQQDGEHLVAVKAGVLQQSKQGQVWVQGRQKRYIPVVEDSVVGVILDKHAENFDVDINGPCKALLPVLAFEGATRRNKPNLQVGDVVYARVESADRDMEPTLSCMDASGKAAGYGPLKGGYLLSCSTGLSRQLLSRPPCRALQALGQRLQFELAVGLNGKVWVNSPKPETTIQVAFVLESSEELSPLQIDALVADVVKS